MFYLIISLQKKHREFSLSSDYKGRFRALTSAEYNIEEIVEKFSLPQKIFITKPEEHSSKLTSIIRLIIEKSGTVGFTAEREGVNEYVVGADMTGQTAVIIQTDAQLNFYSPNNEGVPANNITERNLLSELTDNVIHAERCQYILRKPWRQVFKYVPLPTAFPHEPETGILAFLTTKACL